MVDPVTPLFSVKFMQGERRRVFKAHLFSRGKRNQLARGGIILGCESLHPLLQHLSVAQLAQTAEQRFPGAAHSLPPRVGIDEPHAVSQGSAAKLRPALSHSSSTRSIQCPMPNCRSCGATVEGALILRKCMVTYLFPL